MSINRPLLLSTSMTILGHRTRLQPGLAQAASAMMERRMTLHSEVLEFSEFSIRSLMSSVEVFISSPNPGSVSSLDISSDWVVTNCSATNDQPQTVSRILRPTLLIFLVLLFFRSSPIVRKGWMTRTQAVDTFSSAKSNIL